MTKVVHENDESIFCHPQKRSFWGSKRNKFYLSKGEDAVVLAFASYKCGEGVENKWLDSRTTCENDESSAQE